MELGNIIFAVLGGMLGGVIWQKIKPEEPITTPCKVCGGTGKQEKRNYDLSGGSFSQQIWDDCMMMINGICMACKGSGTIKG